MQILTFIQEHSLLLLDITSTTLGLIYLWLEYRASIWLWLVSIIMPAIDTVLYFKAGLYADFGRAIYYCLAAAYGYIIWRCGKKGEEKELPISHFPTKYIVPCLLVFIVAWVVIYFILVKYTNSNVPISDSFVNALSVIALWALAQKYCEQWFLWIIVDIVCCALYAYKGIPFKACLYGLYAVIAVFGYLRWKRLIVSQSLG